MQTSISSETYEFRRKSILGDGSCLYSSFIYVFGISKKISAKALRKDLSYFIRHMDIDNARLLSDSNCKTRDEYCDRIMSNDWGGEPELCALAEKYEIVISVLNINTNQRGQLSINMINYGESNDKFTKCVYIIYDRAISHYDSLYLCDKKSPGKDITIFDRDDAVIHNLLEDFIEKNYQSKVLISR